MTKRAAIYARISKADKKVPKVENQIMICKALAEDHDYEVVAIFEDDGIAASGKAIDDTTLKNRPGALALLEAMKDDKFDVLVTAEGERLARTYLDGLEFIRASAAGGVTWHLDTDGPLDPSTPAGEETAVSIFASGRREGRVREFRQKRRYDAERADGMPLWGVRPFGYEIDRITIRPAEADLILDAVVDYLAGTRSMLRIARDWTEAGVLTDGMMLERKGRDGVKRPATQRWTATTVRMVLQRDRNAGIYLHHGIELPKSKIQPIITKQQLDDLKDRVKVGTSVGARAKSLLGGVIRCECGAPMHSTISYSQRKGGPRHIYRHYKCAEALYDKSRSHASITGSIADELFTAFILLDLFNGHVRSPASDVPAALRSVTTRLAANAEEIDHLGELLMDATMKTFHLKAKGKLVTLEAERTKLREERDDLLSRSDDTEGLTLFLDEWRKETSGFVDVEDFEQWNTRFNAVWEAVSIERKQALIKSRYRPTVKVGGRGIGRISPNPVDPFTFAQPAPIDEEEDL